MRPDELSNRLTRNSLGIYVAPGPTTVSYASHGHEECFGIEDRSFWFRHRNNCISSLVRSNPPPAGPILDIGGGNGYVAQRLVSDGWPVVLLEPGEEGARNARMHRHLDHVVQTKIEDAGFVKEGFSAIGMFDVIEHIEGDREFLGNIAPLLKPRGRLYLSIPCHTWLWSQADVDAGHYRRYTEETLRALLDPLFRVDYLSFFFRPLVWPQYLVRALPYRMKLDRRKIRLSNESEHGAHDGLAVRIMNRLLEREAERIETGQVIGFGASALVAATLR